MKNSNKTLRSPLGSARGLGSAKSGVEHWVVLRAMAIALIPVTIYIAIGFLNNVVGKSYESALQWMQSPLPATATLILLLAGLRHFASGMQIVVEDYIPQENIRVPIMLAVRFLSAAMAAAGFLSIVKIFSGA